MYCETWILLYPLLQHHFLKNLSSSPIDFRCHLYNPLNIRLKQNLLQSMGLFVYSRTSPKLFIV